MAYVALDDLQVFRDAARYCDRIYSLVRTFDHFDTETVGAQLVRAADSVGANIAESYGRYQYAERVHFFYYARGSAYETIFWLKRASQRGLLPNDTAENAVAAYLALIALLNGIIKTTSQKRIPTKRRKPEVRSLAETRPDYILEDSESVVPF